MNVAAYSGTQNIYKDMLTAAKSLLMHSNVDKIYFLIEDDEFPYELPPEIECINVSHQAYFPADGPNFSNICSYMVLMRAAYTKIFPDLDRILTIDYDTIVNENISELWDLDLTDYYLAAVPEEKLSKVYPYDYVNMGIAMLNLKKIREEHKDDELIYNLNTYVYEYAEQCAINELFQPHILSLPSDYNVCMQAAPPNYEKITHYAGIRTAINHFPNFDYYENLKLCDLQRNVQDHITLDIIIATYKNKVGLRKTLDSIPNNNDINIIVVDDCSNFNYDDIRNEYPYISLYELKENCGPGMARQFGLDHCSGTYFTFLDTGDYFYENGLETILNQIQKNTYIKLYSFSYVLDSDNILIDTPGNKTIGNVYKRSFIDMYKIHFCKEGSYANEDYVFPRCSKMILEDLYQKYKFSSMIKHVKIPVFYEHIDSRSVTKANGREFFYCKTISGLSTNSLFIINYAEKNKLLKTIILDELCKVLARQYYIFLCVAKDHPEFLEDQWEVLRNYYLKGYYRYSHLRYAKKIFKETFFSITLYLLRKNNTWKNKKPPANVERLLEELEHEQFCPLIYYNLTSN